MKGAKRLILAVVGFTVLFIGIALLVLPGPGIVVIIVGLTILAGQFLWAKSLLDKIKNEAIKAKNRVKKGMKKI